MFLLGAVGLETPSPIQIKYRKLQVFSIATHLRPCRRATERKSSPRMRFPRALYDILIRAQNGNLGYYDGLEKLHFPGILRRRVHRVCPDSVSLYRYTIFGGDDRIKNFSKFVFYLHNRPSLLVYGLANRYVFVLFSNVLVRFRLDNDITRCNSFIDLVNKLPRYPVIG